MSSKFVKKLKKDLKKSPGKAAVLAALFAVAVWFWAPLVMGMFGGPAQPTLTTAGSTADATTTSPIAPATPAATAPPTPWKQIAAAIENDPRMMSVERVAAPRDPFQTVEPKIPKQELESKRIESPPMALDVPPADAGLVLNSTIVGNGRGVARVNGKTYRQGDSIRGTFGNKALNYKIIAIGGRNVVLALGEQEYELQMLRSKTGSATATVDVSSESPDFDPSVLE